MEKSENKTSGSKKVVIHNGIDVLDELEINPGSAIVTSAKIIEGTDKEISDKKKELKLKEKSK